MAQWWGSSEPSQEGARPGGGAHAGIGRGGASQNARLPCPRACMGPPALPLFTNLTNQKRSEKKDYLFWILCEFF